MTFTVLGLDPRTRVVGVATASFSLAVGNSVPALDPASGAVASQAWTNRRLHHVALRVLREGGSPGRAIDAMAEVDTDLRRRQVGMLDLAGRVASHTGTECTPWAGARSGPGHLVLGNCLTGPEVLEAMQQALEPNRSPAGVDLLAERMVAALAAGQAAGGDFRGNQSACVATGRFRRDRDWPPLLDVDLRVDDHSEPIPELARLLDLARSAPPILSQ